MAFVDLKPIITAMTATIEATERHTEALNRVAAAQERANEIAAGVSL